MRKLFICCVVVCIGISCFGMQNCNNGTNCEIVWLERDNDKVISVRDQKLQSDIYQLKHTYGFPMTNFDMYHELSECDKRLLLTNELEFLLNRINGEKSNSNKMSAFLLPKSLYQLFVFMQYLFDISNNNPIRNEYVDDDGLAFSNEEIKTSHGNTQEACKQYLFEEPVQQQYWALNELIVNHLKDKDYFNDGTTEKSISSLLDLLLKNLSDLVISNNQKAKHFLGIHNRESTKLYQMLKDKKLEQLKSFILPIIDYEYQTANNAAYDGTYTLYRGQEKSSSNFMQAKAALSFSDGVYRFT